MDKPHREAWQSALLLLCLSLLDARFSLLLFSNGRIHEMNPLLWVSLQYGDLFFLVIKLALTVFSVFILIIHWNFAVGKGRIRVVWLIRTLIAAYLMIVVYEILLMWHWL